MASIYPDLAKAVPKRPEVIPPGRDPFQQAILEALSRQDFANQLIKQYYGERFTVRVPLSGTLAVGSTTSISLLGFANYATIFFIGVTSDPSNQSTNYDIEIFESDSYADGDSIYLNEVNNHKIRDSLLQPLRYKDKNLAKKLHIKIDNNAGAASFFSIDIRYIPRL